MIYFLILYISQNLNPLPIPLHNGGTAFELHEKYALPFFLTDMPTKEICGSVMAFKLQ